MMLGLSLGIATLAQVSGVIEWRMENLFLGDAAGFWADGFAPPDFTPDLLFGPDTAGFLADGFAPPPFDPAHLFGTNTPGFYAGGYEASL